MSLSKPEEIIKRYFFFEYFSDEYKYIERKLSKSNSANNILMSEKYKEKIYFPIFDTLFIDNATFSKWIFTDFNGYVMKHNQIKLNKKYILIEFIHDVKNFFLNKGLKQLASIKDEKFLLDLDRISSLLTINVSKKELFENHNMTYLHYYYNVYFILITYSDNKREFKNIVEFYKILNEHYTLGTIKLIQNLININIHDNNIKYTLNLNEEKNQNLIVHYLNYNNSKEIKLYLSESNNLIEGYNKVQLYKINKNEKNNTLTSNEEINSKENITKENERINLLLKNNLLSKVNNWNLMEYFKTIIFNMIESMERKDKIKISSSLFVFVKAINNKYVFLGGESLYGISHNNEEYIKEKNKRKLLMDNIYEKKVPKDIQNFPRYKKITNNNFCNGEFCDYQIPKNLKGMKKITKINEFLLNNKVPIMNKFSSRDIEYNLPNQLKLFTIKRVYDNPKLINMILKSYSIYPNGINKDKLYYNIHNEKNYLLEKQKQNLFLSSSMKNIHSIHIPLFTNLDELSQLNKTEEIILYNPKPNKFQNLNMDNLYKSVNVCYNCYIIYKIIDKYIDTIDLNTNKFKNEKLAYSLIKESDNVSVSIPQINFVDNTLLHEEYKESCFIESLKKKLLYSRDKYLKKNRKGISSSKINKNKNPKINQSLSYYININPQKLNVNIIDENLGSEYHKMFKITTQKKKNIKYIIRERAKSNMINRRIHMGYTSNFFLDTKNNSFSKKLTFKKKQKIYQTLDIDILYNLKNIQKSQKISKRKTSRNLLKYDLSNLKKSKSDNYAFIQLERKKEEFLYFDDTININEKINKYYNKIKDNESRNNNKNIISKSQKSTERTLSDYSDKNKENKQIRIISVYYKTNIEEAKFTFENNKKKISKFKNRNNLNINPFNLNITSLEFSKIANLNWNKILSSSKIFIYDNYTAIPYNIKIIGKKERINNYEKSIKLIIFVLNDFFDSYNKYLNIITKSLKKSYDKSKNILKIKIISFNFPGQSNTIWQSEEILNNIYYKNFLDRFLFYLYHQKKVFDEKYKGFFIGFGNGGHVAFSYLSLYEKYFPLYDGAILINSYLSKDKYIDNCMNEIKYYLNKTQDCKIIKSCIYNILNRNFDTFNNKNIINKSKGNLESYSNENIAFNEDEEIKLNGISHIIKGYNYNFDIRNKNNNKFSIETPLVFIHSINNYFIPFKNIEDIISGLNENEVNSIIINNNQNNIDFTSIFRNKKDNDKVNKLIIPIKGTHDLVLNKETNQFLFNIVKKFICDYAIVKSEN